MTYCDIKFPAPFAKKTPSFATETSQVRAKMAFFLQNQDDTVWHARIGYYVSHDTVSHGLTRSHVLKETVSSELPKRVKAFQIVSGIRNHQYLGVSNRVKLFENRCVEHWQNMYICKLWIQDLKRRDSYLKGEKKIWTSKTITFWRFQPPLKRQILPPTFGRPFTNIFRIRRRHDAWCRKSARLNKCVRFEKR